MSLQKIRRRRFGDILLAEGVINQEQLQSALKTQAETGDSIGEILLREGLATEGDIVRTICLQYQLPFINPSLYEVDTGLLEVMPPEFMYKWRMLPLDRIGDTVIIALGEIPSEEVEQEFTAAFDANLAVYFSPAKEIEELLRAHFSLSQDQIAILDSQRRSRNRTGDESAAVAVDSKNLLSTLDSSWEAIFDEAEDNIGK